MAPTAITPEPIGLGPTPKGAAPRADGHDTETPTPLDVLAKVAASHLDPHYKVTEQPIGTRRSLRVALPRRGLLRPDDKHRFQPKDAGQER